MEYGRPIEPLIIRQVPEEEYTHLIVKTSPDKLSEVNAQIEIEWKNLFPSRLYSGRLQNDLRSYIEETNSNVIKIFSFMGILATLLSLTGLFSLVTLSIIKRMKEIGVRKILGATIPNIILTINKDFIVILSLSSILGMVSGYLMIDSIMSSSWAYYQKASFSVFVYSVAFIFITSAIVIIGNTFRAAISNPSETLRNE